MAECLPARIAHPPPPSQSLQPLQTMSITAVGPFAAARLSCIHIPSAHPLDRDQPIASKWLCLTRIQSFRFRHAEADPVEGSRNRADYRDHNPDLGDRFKSSPRNQRRILLVWHAKRHAPGMRAACRHQQSEIA